MQTARFTIFLYVFLSLTPAFAQDTLKVVNWNVLNYTTSDASRDGYYRTVLRHAQPDVLVLEEMTNSSAISSFFSRVVNIVFPGQFTQGPFNFIGGDTYNAIYYKTTKFSSVTNTPIKTALRDISEFKLYNSTAADTFRIYALHLKASSGSSNEALRAAEVDSLRKVTNALTNGKYFVVTGDFNIYGSTESAYTKLLLNNPTDDGHFVDTIHITGTWNNAAYAQYHTQSPRTRSFGGGANGGMDDRFDMLLFSRSIAEGNGKISYLANSMTAIGNDGAHYNDSINRMPNSSVPDSVANGIHYGSDHLPLGVRFIFKAGVTTFTITASAGSNGIISPNGVVQVDSGTNKWFTISPNTGYHVDSVFVDGSYAGAPTSYQFTNVTTTHTISARFAINQYTITASAGSNGSINPSGASVVNYGTNKSYAITPGTGYHVDSLIVDGIKVDSSASYTFNSIAANHTIRAVFRINQYAITATMGAGGVLSPLGSVFVTHGAGQSFTISANAHYSIDSVIVDGVKVDSSTSYTFSNVAAAHSIRAVFVIDRYTITALADSHGLINPSGAVSVAYGTNQAFAISPATGYHIDSVVVDGAANDSTTSFTFAGVSTAHTIHAYFTINQYTITPSAGANGSISPSGVVTAAYGSSQTFTITPDKGFVVATLTVDGLGMTPDSTYSFTAIAADHTIGATFSLAPVTEQIAVADGWNLVSLPLTVSDKTKETLFPTADSYAYSFVNESGYQRQDTLQNGVGYWLKFSGSQSIPITGFIRNADTAAVQPGWILFGTTSMPVAVSAIQQIPPGIISSLIYEYGGNNYSAVDTLFPGKGYWVKSASGGSLILSGSTYTRPNAR